MAEEKFDLRLEYSKLKKKYSLPEIGGICEDFDIEKAIEKESNFILRDIRRTINDKMSAYLHFFEMLINPNSPPMFIFSALRGLSDEDRNKIKEIYKELSKIQIDVMKLDTVYSEEKEALFLKKTFPLWQDLKKKILSIIEGFDKSLLDDEKIEKRGYFG